MDNIRFPPRKCRLCGSIISIEYSYCVTCRNIRQNEIIENEKKRRERGY